MRPRENPSIGTLLRAPVKLSLSQPARYPRRSTEMHSAVQHGGSLQDAGGGARMAKVFILGAGTPTPTPHRRGSAFAVEVGGEILMVDCGPAATFKLVKMGIGDRAALGPARGLQPARRRGRDQQCPPRRRPGSAQFQH